MSLKQANNAIKSAWVAALIYVGVTIALTLIYASGGRLADVDVWNGLDILIMLLLAFGVYKKNRFSAVLLLVYFLGNHIVIWIDSRAVIGLPIIIVFAIFFIQGVRGTFAYHQQQASQSA